MKCPAISAERTWTLVRWGAVSILVLAVVALVPPGSLPYPPESDYSDAAISHWPNAYFLRESIWQYGEWPLWNHLRMLGQPFAANPLSKVWYPPQWLALLLPPTAHLNIMIYLHMAWLALGMLAWLRSQQVQPVAALLATIAWGLNPKLIGHLGAGHLDIVYALAWIPWLLWAVSCTVDRPSMGRGGLVGGVAALLVLADVRVAFYMLPAIAIYAAVGGLTKRNVLSDSWMAWGLAVGLLLLLTAVQTIPLLAISRYLTRSSLTAQEAAVFSLPPRYLIGALLPDVGGFHEWMTYLGLPVIGLAIVGLAQRKEERWRARLWWGLMILALLWALGSNGPLFMPIVEHLPLAGWFRVPSRAWFVVVLSLIIASLYGLEGLLKHGMGRYGRLIALVIAFAGAVWSFVALAIPSLSGAIVGVGMALCGTGSGLWLAGDGLVDIPASPKPFSRMQGRLVGAVVLLVTLTLSLLGVDVTLVEARSMADIEGPEQAIVAQLEGSCKSVYSPTFDLLGPATARAGLATLHGVDPFQLESSARSIAAAAGVEVDGYSVLAPPLPPGEVDLGETALDVDVLRTLGVCWVVAPVDVPSGGLPIYAQLDDLNIYRVPGGQLDSHLVIRPLMGVNGFETQVCTGRYEDRAWVYQAWAPGWRAWVDGEPVQVITQQGMLVVDFDRPAGCYMVRAAYRPLADFLGMGVTGLTLIVLVVWVILRKRQEEHHA